MYKKILFLIWFYRHWHFLISINASANEMKYNFRCTLEGAIQMDIDFLGDTHLKINKKCWNKAIFIFDFFQKGLKMMLYLCHAWCGLCKFISRKIKEVDVVHKVLNFNVEGKVRWLVKRRCGSTKDELLVWSLSLWWKHRTLCYFRAELQATQTAFVTPVLNQSCSDSFTGLSPLRDCYFHLICAHEHLYTV